MLVARKAGTHRRLKLTLCYANPLDRQSRPNKLSAVLDRRSGYSTLIFAETRWLYSSSPPTRGAQTWWETRLPVWDVYASFRGTVAGRYIATVFDQHLRHAFTSSFSPSPAVPGISIYRRTNGPTSLPSRPRRAVRSGDQLRKALTCGPTHHRVFRIDILLVRAGNRAQPAIQ